VRRLHNQGNFSAAARAFNLYNKAKVNGVETELPGLVSRRMMEAAIYLKPVEGTPTVSMAQAVTPESSLAKSPTNLSGLAVVGAGAVTALSTAKVQVLPQASSAVNTVVETSHSMNIEPLILLSILLIGLGVYIMYTRFKTRSGGWS
jgi:lysozyme